MDIDSKFSAISNLLLGFTSRQRSWKLYLALFCSLYCLVTAPADYSYLLGSQPPPQAPWWKALNYQVDHPLALNEFIRDNNVSAADHVAKMGLRLTMPLVGKLFPTTELKTRIFLFMVLQFFFCIVFFYVICKWALEIFNDPVTAIFFTCGFSVLYVGKAFTFDSYIYFDASCFLFLLLSVTSRNPIAIMIFFLAALFTDERAMVAGVFVFLYHLMPADGNLSFRSAFSNKKLIMLCLGGVVHIALRLYLGSTYNLTPPVGNTADAGLLQFATGKFANRIPIGLFLSFKTYWWLIALPLFYFKRFYLFGFIYATAVLLLIMISASVVDYTRSLSYIFVAVFPGIRFLKTYVPSLTGYDYKRFLILLYLSSVIIPTYFFFGEGFWLSPFDVIKKVIAL